MTPSSRPSARLRVAVSLALAQSLLWAGPVFAQTDSERIAELERLVRQLSDKVNELSQAKPAAPVDAGATAATAPADPAAAARIEALERSVTQLTESAGKPQTNVGVPLHGFADVGYTHSQAPAADDRKGGFTMGNLDLFLTPELSERVKMLAEVVIEYGADGTIGTDVERMQLGYTVNDALTLWGGRFHTPYGYWSTAFHHGAQIQTSLMRPRFIDFEDKGGVLPAHTVGIWGTGRTSAGDGKVTYDVFVGNGGRVVDGTLDFQPVRDSNGNKSLGGKLGYEFSGSLAGLALGVHGNAQTVDVYTGGAHTGSDKFRYYGGYGVYDTDDWEVLTEYYRFKDQDNLGGSGSHSSWAGFAQAGRRLDGGWTPYLRYEKASLDQTDPYFFALASGGSYTRTSLGLRYDLTPRSALKLEVNRTDEKRIDSSYNEVRAQFSVRF